MKSRQVERAEFRAEVNKGERSRRQIERKKSEAALEDRKTQSSTLLTKAMSAVSRLSRAHITKAFGSK